MDAQQKLDRLAAVLLGIVIGIVLSGFVAWAVVLAVDIFGGP